MKDTNPDIITTLASLVVALAPWAVPEGVPEDAADPPRVPVTELTAAEPVAEPVTVAETEALVLELEDTPGAAVTLARAANSAVLWNCTQLLEAGTLGW